MDGYWTKRIDEAVKQAEAAPNDDLRNVYLDLAAHYRSMLEFCLIGSKQLEMPRHNWPLASNQCDSYRHPYYPR